MQAALSELYWAAFIGDKPRLWEALKAAYEFLPDNNKPESGINNDYVGANPYLESEAQ